MISKEEAEMRFLFPHQKMRNFRQEAHGYVSFEVGDHIKNDFWFVLTDGIEYVTSAQYHGLFYNLRERRLPVPSLKGAMADCEACGAQTPHEWIDDAGNELDGYFRCLRCTCEDGQP